MTTTRLKRHASLVAPGDLGGDPPELGDTEGIEHPVFQLTAETRGGQVDQQRLDLTRIGASSGHPAQSSRRRPGQSLVGQSHQHGRLAGHQVVADRLSGPFGVTPDAEYVVAQGKGFPEGTPVRPQARDYDLRRSGSRSAELERS